MERMNEILARAANRRISTRRIPTPAPATATDTPASGTPTMKLASRRSTPGQPTNRPTGGATPLRPRPSADASQAIQPAADVADTSGAMENDRILEMPARPAPRVLRSEAERPATRSSRPAEMASIRELTSTYAAQLPRRPGRATPSVTPAASTTPAAQNDEGGRAVKPAPQGRRASRAAGTASAPGVCPLCHGAGYVRLDVPMGDPAFGQAIRCQCKEQQLEDRDRGNLRRLSNLDPFRDKTFETFDSKRPGKGVQEAYREAYNFAKDPLGWLVFRGGYGCGKTHLAAAIANVAEKNGIPVIFAIVPELLDHLRATFAPSSDTPYDALFDKVREVQLLVLDDFGAENGTAWATEKLFQLINYRYNYRMPTVITTNDRLLARVDERISSRLFDQGLVRHVIMDAKDYRKYGKPSARLDEH